MCLRIMPTRLIRAPLALWKRYRGCQRRFGVSRLREPTFGSNSDRTSKFFRGFRTVGTCSMKPRNIPETANRPIEILGVAASPIHLQRSLACIEESPICRFAVPGFSVDAHERPCDLQQFRSRHLRTLREVRQIGNSLVKRRTILSRRDRHKSTTHQ